MKKILSTILIFFTLFTSSAQASFLWGSGAELNSATALMEVDSVTGTPTISSTIKRSGNYAWRFNASGSATYFQHQYSAGVDTFYSAWFYFSSYPSSTAIILALWDGADGQYIQMTTAGRLQFISAADAQIGSDTEILNLNQWYNIQLAGQDTPANQEAKLDGVTIGTLATGYSGTSIRVGVQSAVTMDMYVDDIIVNNDLASNENTYPNMNAKLVFMRPDSAGDSNTWEKSGGGAGSSTNYQDVDEVTPDNGTTYIVRDTGASNQPKDQYNLESTTTVGIPTSSTILVVATGGRVGAISATSAAGRNGNFGIKSGATEAWSGSIDWSINGYTTMSDPVPRTYRYVAYVDPADAGAFTTTDLDSLQVGVRANSAATTDLRVSTTWVLVQYVPYTGIKTVNSLVKASIDMVKGLKFTNWKTWNGLQ